MLDEAGVGGATRRWRPDSFQPSWATRGAREALLEELERDELLGIVERVALEVADRRVRDRIVEALAYSRRVRLRETLRGPSSRT
jgi:hypothetical protein